MESIITPHSKILTIINDEYAKMIEKEKLQTSSTSPTNPSSETLSDVKAISPRKLIASKLRKIFDVRRTVRNYPSLTPIFTRVPFRRSTKFGNGKRNLTDPNFKPPEKESESVSWKEKVKGFFNAPKEVLWWNPPEGSLPIEFCRDSSLHGLKYIGQHDRHISERIFWVIAFFAGLILAVVLISDVWNKYNTSPIIVSFEPSQTTVDEIPFPAVTVCNMNKVLKSKAEDYIEKASQGDEEALKDVFYMDHVCAATRSFSKQFNFAKEDTPQIVKDLLEKTKHISSELTQVNEFLRKASQNCSDMIPRCIWQDEEFTNCSKLFRPIETEFGKCCTFNAIPHSGLYKLRNESRDDPEEVKAWEQWNKESDTDVDGVLLGEQNVTYPRRQMEPGKSSGLSIMLNPSLNEYFCTTSDSTGFRVETHWPTDQPHVTDFGISIRTKAEVFVDVRPDITLVDPSVFKFDTNVRKCYRLGEYSLKFFNYYTIRNCVDECIANETETECKCKRYFMPRAANESLCGGNHEGFQCAENVRAKMIVEGAKRACKQCLPSCSEVNYLTSTTTTPLQVGIWNFQNGSKAEDFFWATENVSIVHVYMGQDSTYARVRRELFGSTDLFANTGGLMGLCLGFSGLSFLELIYFFTLRAWWASRRKFNIREKISRKLKAAWIKVKALLVLKNGQAGLDKQVEKESDGGVNTKHFGAPIRLHMSPAYNSRSNFPTIAYLEQENKKSEDDLNTPEVKVVDYKNILGHI